MTSLEQHMRYCLPKLRLPPLFSAFYISVLNRRSTVVAHYPSNIWTARHTLDPLRFFHSGNANFLSVSNVFHRIAWMNIQGESNLCTISKRIMSSVHQLRFWLLPNIPQFSFPLTLLPWSETYMWRCSGKYTLVYLICAFEFKHLRASFQWSFSGDFLNIS